MPPCEVCGYGNGALDGTHLTTKTHYSELWDLMGPGDHTIVDSEVFWQTPAVKNGAIRIHHLTGAQEVRRANPEEASLEVLRLMGPRRVISKTPPAKRLT